MKFGFLLTLVASQISFSQNLVPNSGFEEYYNCPTAPNINYKTKELAQGWNSPTGGTPDLYNSCNKGSGNIPHNWAGVARSHSGDGYAGIYVWASGINYREYLQTKLKTTLQKDKIYRIEFFFRLASYSRHSIDRIGILLTDSAVNIAKDKVIERNPTISKVYDSAFRKSSGLWEKVSQQYIAHGGELYMIIGNFFDDDKTKNFHINYEPIQEPMLASACYFYIDDVSVMDVDSIPSTSLPFTYTSEIKPNETYVLKNIQFEFGKSNLKPSFIELEKLLSILKANTQWKIVLTGHTDDVGSAVFNRQLSESRAASVGKFLIANGINKNRISTRGRGKDKPLQKENTEGARAINRRVEVTFIHSMNENK